MSELSLQLKVLTSCMRENIFKFKALNLLYVHKCPWVDATDGTDNHFELIAITHYQNIIT